MNSLLGICSMDAETGIPQPHEVINITAAHIVRLYIKQLFYLHKQ